MALKSKKRRCLFVLYETGFLKAGSQNPTRAQTHRTRFLVFKTYRGFFPPASQNSAKQF